MVMCADTLTAYEIKRLVRRESREQHLHSKHKSAFVSSTGRMLSKLQVEKRLLLARCPSVADLNMMKLP